MSSPISHKGQPQKPDVAGPANPIDLDSSQSAESSEEVQGPEAVEVNDAEQLPENQGINQNRRSADNTAKTRQHSEFHEEVKSPQPEKIPQQFGHKINTQALANRDRTPSKDTVQTRNTETPQPKQQTVRDRPMPQEPSPQLYKSVLSERFFRGPLRGSPLEQKLQPKATQQSEQPGTPKQQVRRDFSEPLDKGEVLQMFRLRNQAEQKENFRNVLKYELAKARALEKNKVQGNKFQTEAHHKKNDIDIGQRNKVDSARDKILHRLQTSNTQSKFENVLQKIMKGEKAVPDLPEGTKARFNNKTEAEWEEFYKNTKAMGSELVKTKAELNKLIEARFRGMLQNNNKNNTLLVTDLSFTENGEVSENKFSQLELKDQQTLDLVKQLKPGEPLPQSLLDQLGSELDFLKLVHIVQSSVTSEEQQKEILKFFRQQQSGDAQRKMEESLIKKRDSKKSPSDDLFPYPGPPPKHVEPLKGPPKLFMPILYGLGIFTLIFIVYFIMRAMGLI